MFKLDNPDAVQSLSMVGGRTWYLQPGTLEVHGSTYGLLLLVGFTIGHGVPLSNLNCGRVN
jgi:hypothetical protein